MNKIMLFLLLSIFSNVWIFNCFGFNQRVVCVGEYYIQTPIHNSSFYRIEDSPNDKDFINLVFWSCCFFIGYSFIKNIIEDSNIRK